jgi:hypothetical protein
MSIGASPACGLVISRLSKLETAASMCWPMVRTVRGLSEISITGTIGLPITLPWPVGRAWIS